MKNLSLLVWLTQLAISVIVPLLGCTLLSVWLKQRFALGPWAVIVGVVIGLVFAVDGLRVSLKAMERMAKSEKETKTQVSFNDHQ